MAALAHRMATLTDRDAVVCGDLEHRAYRERHQELARQREGVFAVSVVLTRVFTGGRSVLCTCYQASIRRTLTEGTRHMAASITPTVTRPAGPTPEQALGATARG